ncbi:MAG: hypothetical protein HZB13_06465 [Acidobacteria bacterium]|nr:hypothetical protein [Acidobacteriota bacterium]
MPLMTRRRFALASLSASRSGERSFHVCLAPDALEADSGLLALVRDAGVTDVWVAGFFYGHWYYTPDRIARHFRAIKKAGLRPHAVQLPLGHPGDSLGAVAGQPPLIPPPHWSRAVRSDGRSQWGTSLHPPATQENAAALRRMAAIGARDVFLDDDFRLAPGPGAIGGCYCDRHIDEFRRLHGLSASVGDQIHNDVRTRAFTPLLRQWLDFHCSQLTASFRAMQKASPRLRLGIMVMYLGAEKAGIRLSDYSNVPFRVGELMFRDRDFTPVKGKTDELFSALFHRRFTPPELAYSESTAFPANELSAPNLAAKLAVSTLADVRHTMFMSGLTPFPRAHWEVLKPAIQSHRTRHRKFAGLAPQGPFKHFWGEASRYAGDDKPYSLFLAAGVPFEVCHALPAEGHVFLSDADALTGTRSAATLVSRAVVPETLADLFRLKARFRPSFEASSVPFVLDEKPAVLAWFPSARAALLWNLSERPESFAIRLRSRDIPVQAGPLALVEMRDL